MLPALEMKRDLVQKQSKFTFFFPGEFSSFTDSENTFVTEQTC